MELQPEHKLGYFFWSNQGADDYRKLWVELNLLAPNSSFLRAQDEPETQQYLKERLNFVAH